MISDSLGNLLGIAKGSLTNLGGSIGDQAGNGIGSIADNLNPILDGIATGSRQGEGGGK
ncbi:hypothetical protein [Tomitella cavernea]|uniref:Uncharacterized protein n=1 Tax=Tomitella cavernea TaxID=1387982 RepID=A0ABP9CZN9_9ACTN|nr:hypothetical protein [Tomitella cavernea]